MYVARVGCTSLAVSGTGWPDCVWSVCSVVLCSLPRALRFRAFAPGSVLGVARNACWHSVFRAGLWWCAGEWSRCERLRLSVCPVRGKAGKVGLSVCFMVMVMVLNSAYTGPLPRYL